MRRKVIYGFVGGAILSGIGTVVGAALGVKHAIKVTNDKKMEEDSKLSIDERIEKHARDY